MQSLNPYAEDLASDLAGTGNVSLTLDGTLDQPKLNGTIGFKDGSATISFLNSRYTFSDAVRVYNNNLYLDFIGKPEKIKPDIDLSSLINISRFIAKPVRFQLFAF